MWVEIPSLQNGLILVVNFDTIAVSRDSVTLELS